MHNGEARGESRLEIDWGHLAFIVFMAGLIVWYILDARATSLSFNNLLFIQPTAFVAFVLLALIVPQCFKRVGNAAEAAPIEKKPVDRRVNGPETIRIIAITAALGIFSVAIHYIGFDIGTWLFALAAMFICGERRPLYLAIYPALVALAVISTFKAMIPFPMFTILL